MIYIYMYVYIYICIYDVNIYIYVYWGYNGELERGGDVCSCQTRQTMGELRQNGEQFALPNFPRTATQGDSAQSWRDIPFILGESQKKIRKALQRDTMGICVFKMYEGVSKISTRYHKCVFQVNAMNAEMSHQLQVVPRHHSNQGLPSEYIRIISPWLQKSPPRRICGIQSSILPNSDLRSRQIRPRRRICKPSGRVSRVGPVMAMGRMAPSWFCKGQDIGKVMHKGGGTIFRSLAGLGGKEML